MSGFCQQTCGTCSSGCTDIPPDATYTCPQQARTLLCFDIKFWAHTCLNEVALQLQLTFAHAATQASFGKCAQSFMQVGSQLCAICGKLWLQRSESSVCCAGLLHALLRQVLKIQQPSNNSNSNRPSEEFEPMSPCAYNAHLATCKMLADLLSIQLMCVLSFVSPSPPDGSKPKVFNPEVCMLEIC